MMITKQTFFTACAVVLSLLSLSALAQEDERYDFDGIADSDPQPDDPTDWMTSKNWSDGGFDPDAAFGPLLPDFGTRVEIDTSEFGVNAPEIGPGDTAEAFGVRIGRFGGEGLLTMTGGSLDLVDRCLASPFTCNSRLRVGAASVANAGDRNPGTFNLSGGTVTTDTLWIGSGSQGQMNMSGGAVITRGDFSMDWSFDAGSHFSMTDGTVNVGTNLRMYRNSSFDLDGGMVLIAGFAGLGYADNKVTQTPNVTVNISNGLLEADSFLRVEGSVTVDGGILRANSYNETLSTGTVEINGAGLLQFNNAQESVFAVEALITSGVLTTSEASPLTVEVVDIGGINFTQVSIVSIGLDGDFDRDTDVDGDDFLVWQQGFPDTFNANDLATWQSNFGLAASLPMVRRVPEPSSLGLVLVLWAGIIMVFRCPWNVQRARLDRC